MCENRPVRVLHSLGSMNRGGIETWLMHVLRRIDRKRFKMDFLVRTAEPGAYDSEIESLGSKVIPCVDPRRPWQFIPNLIRKFRDNGPYDVVHCHDPHYGTAILLHMAARLGVPGRIDHSHNDARLIKNATFCRRVAAAITRPSVARNTVLRLAVGGYAAEGLFGSQWKSDSRVRILRCAVDLDPFSEHVDRKALREELGIPEHAFVVGHVGRFDKQKNHSFLIDIALEVSRLKPDVRFLLVGDGPLRSAMERKVARVGLEDRAIFAGVRADVPRLMLGAVDVFVFPSLFEGLGLAVIEAQAAGLPCVCSDRVPAETGVVKPLFHRLSLSRSAADWARQVVALRGAHLVAQPEALALMEQSPFNVTASVREIEDVYSRFAAQ